MTLLSELIDIPEQVHKSSLKDICRSAGPLRC